jgi:acetyl esterase/lipase
MPLETNMDRAYANSAFIPGSDALPAQWEAQASTFRASLGPRAHLAMPYGPKTRNAFDLFLPETPAKGLMIFIHGGYWMATGRESWSHLAAGALAHGWACAMPSYTLAPDARISEMSREITAATRAAQALIQGPTVITGHSAGGHLAARMACTDINLQGIIRSVPISPIADLAPLMQTEMNETLHLTPEESRQESPAYLNRRPEIQAHVWVGAMERPAFLWQARLLSENWACPWTPAPDKHHFNVIDELQNPASPLMETLLGA